MIRLSSQQVFSTGISRMQEINSSLNKTQEQISTGQRVNRPSDDPVAAAAFSNWIRSWPGLTPISAMQILQITACSRKKVHWKVPLILSSASVS